MQTAIFHQEDVIVGMNCKKMWFSFWMDRCSSVAPHSEPFVFPVVNWGIVGQWYGTSMKLRFTFVLALCLCPFPWVFAADGKNDHGDHAEFSHAMEVETREVDQVPVVFQYGEVRPDFEAMEGNNWRRRWSLDGKWDLKFEDADTIHEVMVPHCWGQMPGSQFWKKDNLSSKNPATYAGVGWYRKSFEVSPVEGKRYRLEFRGVRERARVFVNDHLVALHEGVGAPFAIDVTRFLKAGENEVRLKVWRHAIYRKDNEGKWHETSGEHTPYPKSPDYWPYAGVTGSVALWEESAKTIRKVQVKTVGDQLVVRAVIENQSREGFRGEVRIASEALGAETLTREVMIPAGKVKVVEMTHALGAGVKRWSPDSPQLYSLEARLLSVDKVVDGADLRFGVREFGVKGNTVELNGKPIFLKGAAVYSETDHGIARTREEHWAILKLAKDAGANFVRLPVRQRDPVVYQIADEMGLMLSGEWGGFWYTQKSMKAQTEDEKSIFQSMGRVAVWDLMNRPSVVLWCTHNESHQFCKEYEFFVKMNRDLVRELDQGMLPVTWAAWHPTKGEPCFQYADIIGFNEYRGAMDAFEDLQPDMKKVAQDNPGKPLIILENGAWSKLGKRGKSGQRGTEDWQANLITRQFGVLNDFTPPLVGYTYWLLKDYRSGKHYTATRSQNGWSRMGMYDSKGQPKLAKEVFQKQQMGK